MKIRLADPASDAGAIAAIYRPAVEDSTASFEERAPTPDEMAGRIRGTLPERPWLVAIAAGQVVGYAYASSHHERPGYRWSVDVSIYVRGDRRGQRVGRRLYAALLAILRLQGFQSVYAGIALPNAASVALHEAIGMRRVGVYRGVGYKFGAWHDVAWYGIAVGDLPAAPAEPTPLRDLLASPDGAAAVRRALEAR